MILLFAFAFLSGLVTILAPCIWPLLPIVLSASFGKGKSRPLGITIGVVVSFYVFSLFLSYLISIFHFDPNILRIFAVIILFILGLSMLIPQFSDLLEAGVSRISGRFGNNKILDNGFLGGFVTGMSLGIVWSPCAGPILASIVTLNSLNKFSFSVAEVSLFYVLGMGIPLFIFSFLGRKFFTKIHFLSKYLLKIQKIFAVIVLLMALAIFTNYDKYIEAQFLNAFPFLGTNLNGFENSSLISGELNNLKGINSNAKIFNDFSLFNADYQAPDFIGITKWLNLPRNETSLDLSQLKGKVVLVDFWTYTCINCIRTLPHVASWYDKYKKYGLVVVGVHTPEFEFEHDTNNVVSAIKMYGINYPVAQDSNYATWNNYNNQYWPAEYLIDQNGIVRRTEFGEGGYDKMELAIRELLQLSGKKIAAKITVSNNLTTLSQKTISPETYLGSDRMQFYYPTGNLNNGLQEFTLDSNLTQNTFSLGGKWDIGSQSMTTTSDSKLLYNFNASNVYLVLNPPQGINTKVEILLDGKPVPANLEGSDVKDSILILNQDRLYNLINLHGNYSNHVLELDFKTPGVKAFAFTFG